MLASSKSYFKLHRNNNQENLIFRYLVIMIFKSSKYEIYPTKKQAESHIATACFKAIELLAKISS